eukprot:TRINITY_DN7345_c0_g1_i1.p1 TRINITY_DN7345_c0_g1~~TRINITY_DN7345_c0_g1_i1.p1  ORF type:complete len:280 (-),score=76.44 TRINITY_DN7345_c0_g1_i1:17-856(-)
MDTDSDPCRFGRPNTFGDFSLIVAELDNWSIAAGIVLIAGSVLAIFPQHISILMKRSTEGISPFWVFLSQLNQFSALINSLLLNFPIIRSCSVISFSVCAQNLLVVWQFFGIWISSLPLYMWLFLFTSKTNSPGDWRFTKWSYVVFLAYSFFVVLTSGLLLEHFGDCSNKVIYFGRAMGIISILFTAIQWAPQLWRTFKSKSGGSFSVLMLLIQIPGNSAVVYYLAIISKQDPSTWVSFVLSIFAQSLLLFMIFYFRFTNRKRVRIYKPNTESDPILYS